MIFRRSFQQDGSAAEAINKLALVPGSYDAVIIDVGLPDRKGDTLIHEMKAIYPHLPIVLATGHNSTICAPSSRTKAVWLSPTNRILPKNC
jgi:DNA-binding NtrC family response regulator